MAVLDFDKTITIYHKGYDSATRKTTWTKTVVRGVSWAGRQRIILSDGIKSNDGYSVRIPPESLGGFLVRDEYLLSPAGHWTVYNEDIVLLGEGPEVMEGITEITSKHTDCFTVTAVNTSSLMRPLPHLRIEGR